MTADRDIERVLEHWLVDGVDQMPDRVRLSILDRVEREPQRRAWRVSWRDTHMNTYLKYAVAVAAVVVLGVVGLATFGSRPGSNVGGPAPSPSPSPSVTPPATPLAQATPQWWAVAETGPCGESGCGGILAPGTYTSRSLTRPLTYTVPTGWVNSRDWPDYFELTPDTPANRTAVAAGDRVSDIVILSGDPAIPVASADCQEGKAEPSVGTSAAEVTGALAAREGLTTSAPVPVTIRALSGSQLDLSVQQGWARICALDPDGPGVALTISQAVTAGNRVRLILLDTPRGGSIEIKLSSQIADFDSFVAAAMPIVDSFTFDLGPEASPS
jgi:hypothetical protein